MTTAAAARPAAGIGRLLIAGLLAGLAAGVANLIFYFLTRAIFSLPYLVPVGGPASPPAPLPLVAIVMACVVPGLVAAAFYWLLGRFTARATPIFTGVAVAFALISLAGPLTLPIDTGTRVALAVMHLIAAPIIVAGILRAARPGA